jgi:hypothetical protein
MFAKVLKFALILALISAASLVAADLKVKTIRRVSGAGHVLGSQLPPEVTIYVHDMAQRVESFGFGPDYVGPRQQMAPHTAVITRCDTGMVYQLDLNNQEYVESKLAKSPSQEQFAKQMAQEQKEDQKHAQSSTVDTGETKNFYGHIAKHVVTTIKGKDKERAYEEVVDGWYLDLPQPGCTPEYLRQYAGHMETADVWTARPRSSPYDQYSQLAPPVPGVLRPPLVHSGMQSSFVYNWFIPGGLTIQQTSTQHQTVNVDGRKRINEMLTEERVVEFSEAPLDPSLFEVPPGFKKVHELYQHKQQR